MSTRIFYDNIAFRLKSWKKIKNLIGKVIRKEGKIPGDLNFIMTDDVSLKEINVQFLQHNYFTDVISFDYSNNKEVIGEIYISADCVKRNAKNYKVSYNEEVLRVIIHGVLHICGYDDATEEEKLEMSRKENYWLKEYRES